MRRLQPYHQGGILIAFLLVAAPFGVISLPTIRGQFGTSEAPEPNKTMIEPPSNPESSSGSEYSSGPPDLAHEEEPGENTTCLPNHTAVEYAPVHMLPRPAITLTAEAVAGADIGVTSSIFEPIPEIAVPPSVVVAGPKAARDLEGDVDVIARR